MNDLVQPTPDDDVEAAIASLEQEVQRLRARVRMLEATPPAGAPVLWKRRSNLVAMLAFVVGIVVAYAMWFQSWAASR